MSRVLIVVPPLTGHTNPTVAVGQELLARGHEVAWCGYPGFLRPLLPDGATIVAAGDDLPGDLVSAIEARAKGLRGAAALKFLWEDFLHPLADAMVSGVDAAVRLYRPDVMMVDQQAIAGALVARRNGIPWATSATTSADLVDPFENLPKLRSWVDQRLVEFQIEHGVPEGDARPEAVRFSDDLVLAFTTTALVGEHHELPPHFRFIGPASAGRPTRDDFPWEWLDPRDDPGRRPAVLVSLGTVNADAGTRFFEMAVEALGSAPFQVVVVAPPDAIPDPPDNVLVRARVPQVALLEQIDVVVSHGGHNTVCETLSHGIPLVVAPIRDDQPVIADQVASAGAGIRVKFARVRPTDLRVAVTTLLDDPSYRAAAAAIAASFAAAGGAVAAADHLEALVRPTGARPSPTDHPPTSSDLAGAHLPDAHPTGSVPIGVTT